MPLFVRENVTPPDHVGGPHAAVLPLLRRQLQQAVPPVPGTFQVAAGVGPSAAKVQVEFRRQLPRYAIWRGGGPPEAGAPPIKSCEPRARPPAPRFHANQPIPLQQLIPRRLLELG